MELLALLGALDDGAHGVCHCDFHPLNVLVGPDGWVVIDWLTVAAGPPAADLARTLVLWSLRAAGPVGHFLRAVRQEGRARQGLAEEDLDAWVRVVAAAPCRRGVRGRRARLAAAGGERCGAPVRNAARLTRRPPPGPLRPYASTSLPATSQRGDCHLGFP